MFMGQDFEAVASLLSSKEQSTLFLSAHQFEVLGLSRLVNDNVRLELAGKPSQIYVPDDVTTVFVWQPNKTNFPWIAQSSNLVARLQDKGNWSAPEHVGVDLWQLSRLPSKVTSEKPAPNVDREPAGKDVNPR